GHGQVGVRIPVQVVFGEVDVGVALAREVDDALDVVLGDHRLARGGDGGAQVLVLLGVETGGPRGAAARRHDRVEVLVGELRAGDQGRDLLLLDHLPV